MGMLVNHVWRQLEMNKMNEVEHYSKTKLTRIVDMEPRLQKDLETKVIKIKSLGNRDNKYMTIRRSQNDK